jgi:putative component of toxin-antitoxin plasmid stabilization module
MKGAWVLVHTAPFEQAAKWYQKKRKREYEAVLRNLGRYRDILDLGTKSLQMTLLGFVHDERKGVHALSEAGGGKGLQATRLYLYPDEETRTIHLITIGDKKSQPDDVKQAQAYVAKQREQQADHEQADPAKSEDLQERGGDGPEGPS